ncbi:MAG TPA: nuclear transport factor 2 family protein [Solirubrobacterales bacterium]|nr:nuclear transport factor 2 family protein [Solirubrobacterales bacterium]
MASTEQRESLARAGMEAFNAGDTDRMLAALASDIEVYASPEMANAGTFHGHDGFVAWIAAWTDAWEAISAEVTDTTTVGDRHIVTAIHQEGRGREGIELTMELAFLFDVGDDGLCHYLAMLPTAEEAVELARERES